MGATGVTRSGAGGEILAAMTVIGTLAIVVAIAFFSSTGSGLGTDLSLSTGGFMLGLLLVGLLSNSRSPYVTGGSSRRWYSRPS